MNTSFVLEVCEKKNLFRGNDSVVNDSIEMEVYNSIEMEVCDNFNDSVSDSDFDERAGTPVELIEAAAEANGDLLPFKSKGRYQKVYDDYIKWKESKKATSNSERVVVSYFSEMAKSKKKPTTLWSHYSMLKATLKVFVKVDIATYVSVTAMLKRKSHGYLPKKAKVFSEAELQQFLDNAPDVAWLDVKVTSLFKIFFSSLTHLFMTGRFGIWSLRMLSVSRNADIIRHDDMYYVTVPAINTKTLSKNSFAITGPMLDIVRHRSIGCASTSTSTAVSSDALQSADSLSPDLSSVGCHRKVAAGAATSSVDESVAIDPMRRPVIPLVNVDTSSGERGTTSTAIDATGQEAMNTDDADAFVVEPKSQNINSTQVSSQTFMAEMEKRFAFYKCGNLTINFQPIIKQKKN